MPARLLALYVFAALSVERASAADGLPSPDSSTAMGWLLAGLAALAVALNQILGAVINVRKLKGVDVAADGRYASAGKVGDLEKDVAALRGEITQINTTLSNELRAIHRSLGRIEGRLGTDPGH